MRKKETEIKDFLESKGLTYGGLKGQYHIRSETSYYTGKTSTKLYIVINENGGCAYICDGTLAKINKHFNK